MTWARFEDRFPWHRKVRALSDGAFRLHVSAICWSTEHLTDGYIPAEDLHVASDTKLPLKAVAELTHRGLWEASEQGWLIHDYLIYNLSADQVKAERAAAAERQRRAREAAMSQRESRRDIRRDYTRDYTRESHRESHRSSGDVTVPPTRPVTNQELTPPQTTFVGPPAKITKGSRVPDTWPATDALRTWITEHAPAVDGTRETAQWLDYHRAKGDTAKDWAASWRTWMRRAQTDTERRHVPSYTRPAGHRPSTTDAAVSQTLALAERLAQQEIA